ncbi:hypothetical protein [Rhizobium sp. 768_B6_N1_8]
MNHHHDDRITLRDFFKDLCGMLAAGAFIAAVSIWLPYVAQHY